MSPVSDRKCGSETGLYSRSLTRLEFLCLGRGAGEDVGLGRIGVWVGQMTWYCRCDAETSQANENVRHGETPVTLGLSADERECSFWGHDCDTAQMRDDHDRGDIGCKILHHVPYAAAGGCAVNHFWRVDLTGWMCCWHNNSKQCRW